MKKYNLLGLTIDSIRLFKDWNSISNLDFKEFEEKINAKPIERGKFRDWKNGKYKNFHVKFNPNYGIYIEGSISNFYSKYDSIMELSKLKIVIDRLGKELGLELHSARLFRIDLALNIKTDRNISEYTHHLFCDLPRLKRLEQVDGVLFDSKCIKFAIYNKSLEILEKRGKIVEPSILRLELRIFKDLAKFLQISNLKVQDFYNGNNLVKLIELFLIYFNKIKLQSLSLNLINVVELTPAKFSKILARSAIDLVLGGEKEAYRYINQLSNEGKIKGANQANNKSRLRKLISSLSNDDDLSIINPLAQEIKVKVEKECEKTTKQILQTLYPI